MSEPLITLKSLAAKRVTQKVKFMGTDVEIKKLTVREVKEIQELSKGISEEDQSMGLKVMQKVITIGCDLAKDLTEEDFLEFPIDELATLSNGIMKFSGIAGDSGK